MPDELIGDIEEFLRDPSTALPLEIERPPNYSECRHLRVVIAEVSRTVVCKDCEKALDSFWYLLLLAKEWSRRKWDAQRYQEAYEKLEQREANLKHKRHYFKCPDKGPGVEAWATFARWIGSAPFSICYRGQWMMDDGKGSCYSLSYAEYEMRKAQMEECNDPSNTNPTF